MDFIDYAYRWSDAVAVALATDAYHAAVADKALRDAQAAAHAPGYVPALEAIFEWEEDDIAMVIDDVQGEMNVDVHVIAAQNELNLSHESMSRGNIPDPNEEADNEVKDEEMIPIPEQILPNGCKPELIEPEQVEQIDQRAELQAVIDDEHQVQSAEDVPTGIVVSIDELGEQAPANFMDADRFEVHLRLNILLIGGPQSGKTHLRLRLFNDCIGENMSSKIRYRHVGANQQIMTLDGIRFDKLIVARDTNMVVHCLESSGLNLHMYLADGLEFIRAKFETVEGEMVDLRDYYGTRGDRRFHISAYVIRGENVPQFSLQQFDLDAMRQLGCLSNLILVVVFDHPIAEEFIEDLKRTMRAQLITGRIDLFKPMTDDEEHDRHVMVNPFILIMPPAEFKEAQNGGRLVPSAKDDALMLTNQVFRSNYGMILQKTNVISGIRSGYAEFRKVLQTGLTELEATLNNFRVTHQCAELIQDLDELKITYQKMMNRLRGEEAQALEQFQSANVFF